MMSARVERRASGATSKTEGALAVPSETAHLGASHSVKAVLHVDNPVLRDALILFGMLPLMAPPRFSRPWDTTATVACVLVLIGFVLPHWRHRVRVEHHGTFLRVRGWGRRLTLNGSNILDIRQTARALSILLSDGRLLRISGGQPSALAALVEGFWHSPSPQLSFRLRGLPASGRISRLFSRLFPLSLWLRPKLSVAGDCVYVRVLFWTKCVPLSRIARVRVLGHGIELGLADSSSLELCTFAGLSFRWNRRIYDYNELLCAFLQAARTRALNRFLAGYRGGTGFVPSTVPIG